MKRESRMGPGSGPLSRTQAAAAVTPGGRSGHRWAPTASLGRGGAVVAAERATLLSHFRVTPASDCRLG